ncbi:DnaD domain-containing protein [Halobacillus sp. B29]|uniref:DnaD domain-containing protein n=1 Tax=Halobacillus sp. B29 TaxID=3457432 RepID=UPI003FCD4D2C
MQGWLKLHRKILQSEIFENEKLLKIFIYCLTKSSHKNTESRVGRQKVQLKPGQFIFGRKKAAVELNMNESTVRDYFEILEEDGVISIDSTNKYSVITVDNWAIYQSNDEEYDNKTTPDNQQKNNTSPSDRQQKDTYKNGRELKEVKNVKEFITTTTSERLECDSIQFYQNNFGDIRPKISEEIVSWSEDLGEPLILEAMRRSLDRNKPSWGYVKSILQSWINKGIRTIEQAEAEEVEYKNKKNRNGPFTKNSSQKEVIPEWFNDREEQEKQDINKQPSIDDTARTIELAIKLKRSRENILESINDRYNLSEEDVASIKEGKCSAKEILLEQLKLRVAGEP